MKKSIKAERIIAAYRILNTPKNAEKDGINLSELDTKDIFAVLRAVNALKPIATAFDDFTKDAQAKLKPENWDERIKDFENKSEDEKAELNREFVEYNAKVAECVAPELEKEHKLSYDHLSEEAFAKLVKANGHIIGDVPTILLLQEVIG